MDNEKNIILSKLYSLRAGLSLVNMQVDIIRAEEEKVNVAVEMLDQNKKSIKSKRSSKENARKNINYNQNCIKEQKKKLAAENRYIAFNLHYIPVMLFFAAACVAASAIYNAITKDGFSWMWASVGAIIGYVVTRIYYTITDASDGTTKGYMKEINDLQDDIWDDQQKISNCEDSIEDLEKQSTKLEQNKENAIQVYNSQVEVTLPVIKAMLVALHQEFSPLIDKRDWANLDLLIYYFETNRADSIKDALLLTDRQKQMDTLVSAINDASAEISKSMNANFELLREDLNENFSSLASAIHSQRQAQERMMSQMNASIKQASMVNSQISSRLDTIATSNAMQTALLSKINVSSSKLVSSMDSICNDGIRTW